MLRKTYPSSNLWKNLSKKLGRVKGMKFGTMFLTRNQLEKKEQKQRNVMKVRTMIRMNQQKRKKQQKWRKLNLIKNLYLFGIWKTS